VNNFKIFLRNIFSTKKKNFLNKLKFCDNSYVAYCGSSYGGWSFLKNVNLKNKYIISAGLGEDASFDVELISKYNCKIISVDPTPRAIEHHREIIKNSGKKNSKPYTSGGKQEITSYDLTHINSENFILIKKALFDVENQEIKFYSPQNKNYVSHSAIDFSNNDKDYIKVNSITVESILNKFNISDLEILKLDIEGAEIKVLNHILDKKIFPKQILVEYDALKIINKETVEKFEKVHNNLLSSNYKLLKTNSPFPNFLYAR